MKKNIVLAITGAFVLVSLISPTAFSSFSYNGTDIITLNYNFEAPDIKEISINEYNFSHVSISSCEQSEPPGEPSLPVKTVSILLPPHSSVKSINVERNNVRSISNVKNIELGSSVLYPVDEENNMVLSSVDPDNNLYTFSDADYKDNFIPKYDITCPYPKSSFEASGGYKKGFPILTLSLYPVEYDTSSSTLTYCTSMTVKVNLEENINVPDSLYYRDNIADKTDVMDLVDNPSTMSLYSSQVAGTGSSILNSMSNKLSAQSYGSNMLIITTERLKNAAAPYNLQALAAVHKSNDMKEVYIETVESIYNKYQVNSCPEWAKFIAGDNRGLEPFITENFNGLKIRECIRDYYLHNNVGYVLLVGDDDYTWRYDVVYFSPGGPVFAPLVRDSNYADQNEVPTFQLYLYSMPNMEEMKTTVTNSDGTTSVVTTYRFLDGEHPIYTASDLPYGCLDNESTLIFPPSVEWSFSNSSNFFPDLYSEVSVGRAPVSDENDLRNFVKKTISYIQAPSTQYNKVLMAGEYLGMGGDSMFADNMLNELINSCNTYGYTTAGIPSDKYNIQTLSDYHEGSWRVKATWPPYTWTWIWLGSDLISRVNTGGIGYINHIGHGTEYAALKLATPEYFANSLPWSRDYESIEGFNNTCYPIVYSQSCFSAAFDSGSPHSSYYGDSIAEYLTVKTDHGAVAYIGNSHYGWGEPFSTDGPSQRYNRQFIDAIFGEGKTRIGDANQDSKEDNIGLFNRPEMLWLYYCINLLGDPALKFKVTGENQAPIANAGGPYSGNIYESITFDGSASHDADGNIISYKWDFGDGTFGTDIKPSHSYSNTGTYYVSLTVTDNQNAIDGATAKVTITSIPVNGPPLISDEAPDNGSSGLSVDINSLSVVISNPDGDTFNWSIETSPNIGSASGSGEHNGTKTMLITDELEYSTTYKWYVNVTDTESSLATTAIYTFATRSDPSTDVKVTIIKPLSGSLYKGNILKRSFFLTLIIGDIDIEANVTDPTGVMVKNMTFTVSKNFGNPVTIVTIPYDPATTTYRCTWDKQAFGFYAIQVVAYDINNEELVSDEIDVFVINLGLLNAL